MPEDNHFTAIIIWVIRINEKGTVKNKRASKRVTAVTSASGERSNSYLRFVKNVYRSMVGDDRMNALFLLFIHRDIQQNNRHVCYSSSTANVFRQSPHVNEKTKTMEIDIIIFL